MFQVVLSEPRCFTLREVSPPEPKPDEALVRVRRVGLCGTDIHAYHGRQPFFSYPRVLGHELGVEIVGLGSSVDQLTIGDLCSVEPYLNCGSCRACLSHKTNCCENIRVMGVHVDGGMQSLLCVPAHKLHRGNGLTVDQLALVETLAIGAHAVERANPVAGEFVLVIGAGPIGLSTLPFLPRTGSRWLVMDVSEPRLDFVRECFSSGCIIHAAGDNLQDRLREMGGGYLPDVIIDATGNPFSMQRCFDLAAHGGRIVFVGLFQGQVSFDDPNFHRRELTLLASRNALPQTFRNIIDSIRSEEIKTTPWITHRIQLLDLPNQISAALSAKFLIKAMIEA